MNTSASRFPCGLYGVTPDWDDTDRLLDAIRAAARGGMRALQLRRKNASAASLREQARAVVALCRELDVVSIMNDDIRLALDVGADGVHLGRDDGSVAAARQRLGTEKLLGVSCYNKIEYARDALTAGADYIAFGAVYPSSTKPQAVRAPLALLTEARALVSALPKPRPAVVAIGGITSLNAGEVVQAGADVVALVSSLFDADDIEAAARTINQSSLRLSSHAS